MDETRFWRIVDATRNEADGDISVQPEVLTEMLSVLSADEVLSFRRHLVTAHRRAYTRPMFRAAELFLDVDHLGDDSFTDFRTWLVCHGQELFERAVANPDSIVELTYDEEWEDFSAAEEFGAVPDEVYEELTDSELPLAEDLLEMLGEPSGEFVARAHEARAFPRLSARHAATGG